jgi:hypothetical protein
MAAVIITINFMIMAAPGDFVEYHATMESCSDKFHVDIPNVV